MQKQEKQKQESVEMVSNAKQQGNNIMTTGLHVANSNKAKQHNNKIDAAAWIDSLCYHYKQFTFDNNSIKKTENSYGYIFGSRVLNT